MRAPLSREAARHRRVLVPKDGEVVHLPMQPDWLSVCGRAFDVTDELHRWNPEQRTICAACVTEARLVVADWRALGVIQ